MEDNKEVKKPSYEELEDYANKLINQNRKLISELEQITNIINKLPFLFKVVEYKSSFNSDFVIRCVEEIESIMTPVKESEKELEEPKEESKD